MGRSVHFRPFRLDLEGELLWRGSEPVALRRKAFTVLRYLVENAGRLVSKDELLDNAWPNTVVNEESAGEVVRELRRALGDERSPARFIETVYGRGFRFVAPARAEEGVPSAEDAHPALSSAIVGRELELRALDEHLRVAAKGRRQIVFIEGEPGIGKSALVAAFLQRVSDGAGQAAAHVAVGQCVEQHGAAEPYMPVLEALGQLVDGAQREPLAALLRQRAPMWLLQLPWLLEPGEAERYQSVLAGVQPQRMLREFATFVEVMAAGASLVLVLEDLHWSDPATIDLLAVLAERLEPARLLVLATYRAADALLRQHAVTALITKLSARQRCARLELEFLSEAAVAEYLLRRFPAAPPNPSFTQRLHQRTDGNPLFIVALVDHMLREGLVTEGGESLDAEAALAAVPESLRYLVDAQIAALGEAERAVLDAASVAGVTFPAAAVAATLDLPAEEVEAACAALAGRDLFLQSSGSSQWPDGTLTERYAFRHALYQEILYEGLLETRRQRLHRSVGTRLESAYGTKTAEIATELALHFDRGRDYGRAVQHYQAAATNALGRFAHREAVAYLNTALARLATVPADRERDQQELWLQAALATTLLATQGFTVEEMRRAFARLDELSQRLEDPLHRFVALGGQVVFHYNRAQHARAQTMSEELLQLTEGVQAPWLVWGAHIVLGQVLFSRGSFEAAREHLELGVPRSRRPQVVLGLDGGVCDLSYLAVTLLALGYPEQARRRRAQLIERGRQMDHRFSLAFALYFAGVADTCAGDVPDPAELLELCDENGFEFGHAAGNMLRGVQLALAGECEPAIAALQRGLQQYRANGQKQGSPFYSVLLADAYGRADKPRDGLEMLETAHAFMCESDERWYEAELLRVRGELLLKAVDGQQSRVESRRGKRKRPQSAPRDAQWEEAQTCFLRAIEIAQSQHAKLWELRATLSLCRLWQKGSKRKEARERLGAVFNWFTEGLDTRDLQEAKALLEQLGNPS